MRDHVKYVPKDRMIRIEKVILNDLKILTFYTECDINKYIKILKFKRGG